MSLDAKKTKYYSQFWDVNVQHCPSLANFLWHSAGVFLFGTHSPNDTNSSVQIKTTWIDQTEKEIDQIICQHIHKVPDEKKYSSNTTTTPLHLFHSHLALPRYSTPHHATKHPITSQFMVQVSINRAPLDVHFNFFIINFSFLTHNFMGEF
jgi:hypothetical protein